MEKGQRQSLGKAVGPNPIKLVTTTLHPLKRASRQVGKWVALGGSLPEGLLGAVGTASWHKN